MSLLYCPQYFTKSRLRTVPSVKNYCFIGTLFFSFQYFLQRVLAHVQFVHNLIKILFCHISSNRGADVAYVNVTNLYYIERISSHYHKFSVYSCNRIQCYGQYSPILHSGKECRNPYFCCLCSLRSARRLLVSAPRGIAVSCFSAEIAIGNSSNMCCPAVQQISSWR